MVVLSASAEVAPEATFSIGSILLIVLPATIALLGVIVSSIVSSVTTHRTEDRRAMNSVYSELLQAGRQAELEALYATAEFVAKLKAFNRAMSGNSGEGEEDERSAKAFGDFVDAFDGFDSLTRASMTVEALGATAVSDRVNVMRSETLAYVMSLGPSVFKAKHAHEFETRIDALMKDLVAEVRRGFGTDQARRLSGESDSKAWNLKMDLVRGANENIAR